MIDREEIKKMIPHRDPFLLLDSVQELTADKILARFKVEETSPLFARIFPGHYPDNPVTPGVILCEIIFQAGAVLMANRLKTTGMAVTKGVPVVTRIRDARFKQVIKPGDELEITAEFEDQVSNAFYLKGAVNIGGKAAVRVAFTCALAELE